MVLSAEGQTEGALRAFERGADDYVSKPFHEGLLLARLRALLRVKGLLDALTAANHLFAQEQKLARSVQQSMLPPESWQGRGLQVASRCRPCRALSGDFLDIVGLDGGAVGVFLADVTGHGVSAALFSTFLKAQITLPETRAETRSPAAFLERLNRGFLETFSDSGYLLSAMYLIYTPGISRETPGRIRWVRAGHPYPFLIRSGEEGSFLEAGGVLLGLTPTPNYQNEELSFGPGERLYLYTDGLLEQVNASGEQRFGTERLVRILSTQAERSPGECLDTLLEELQEFVGGNPFDDDVTLLALKPSS
jgi:serine phosphatase RsbU (regulator of sigma subunit)